MMQNNGPDLHALEVSFLAGRFCWIVLGCFGGEILDPSLTSQRQEWEGACCGLNLEYKFITVNP